MLRRQLIRRVQSAQPASYPLHAPTPTSSDTQQHHLPSPSLSSSSPSSSLLRYTAVLRSFYKLPPANTANHTTAPSSTLHTRSPFAVAGNTTHNKSNKADENGVRNQHRTATVKHPHLHSWRDKQQNNNNNDSRGGGDDGHRSRGSNDVVRTSRADRRETAQPERTQSSPPEGKGTKDRLWPSRSGRERQRANKKKKGFNRHDDDDDDHEPARITHYQKKKKPVPHHPHVSTTTTTTTTSIPPPTTPSDFHTPSIEDILGMGLASGTTTMATTPPTDTSKSSSKGGCAGAQQQQQHGSTTDTKSSPIPHQPPKSKATPSPPPQQPQQEVVMLTLEAATEALRVHPTKTIVSNSLSLVRYALKRLDTHAASLITSSSEEGNEEEHHVAEHNTAVIRAAHVEIKTLCVKIDALVQELVSVRGDLEGMIELCGEWERHLCAASATTESKATNTPVDTEADLARRFKTRMMAVIQRHISKRSLVGTLRQIIQQHPHQRRRITTNTTTSESSSPPPSKWDPIYHGSIIRTLLKELSDINEHNNIDEKQQSNQKSASKPSTSDTWPLSLLLTCLVAVQSELLFLSVVEKHPWVVISALASSSTTTSSGDEDSCRDVAFSLLKWLETVHWSMRRYDPTGRLAIGSQQHHNNMLLTSSTSHIDHASSSSFSIEKKKRAVVEEGEDGSVMYDSADSAVHDYAEEHNKLTFGSHQQQQHSSSSDTTTTNQNSNISSKRTRGALKGFGTEGSGTTEALTRDILPHKNVIEVDAESGEILRIVEGRGDARTIERNYFLADLTTALLKTLQNKKNSNNDLTTTEELRRRQGDFWGAMRSLTFQLVGKSGSGGTSSPVFSNHTVTTSSLIQQLSAVAGIHARAGPNATTTDNDHTHTQHQQQQQQEARVNHFMASEIKRAMELGILERRRREAEYLSRYGGGASSSSEQRAFPYEWSSDCVSSPPALWMSENVNGVHTSEWVRDSVLQPLSRIMEKWGTTTSTTTTTTHASTPLLNHDSQVDVDSMVVSKFIDDLKNHHQKSATTTSVKPIPTTSTNNNNNHLEVYMFATLGVLLAAYTESLLITAKRYAMVGLRPSNNRNTIAFTLTEQQQSTSSSATDDIDDDQNQYTTTTQQYREDSEEDGVEKTTDIDNIGIGSHREQQQHISSASSSVEESTSTTAPVPPDEIRPEMVEASEVISIFGDRSAIPPSNVNDVQKSIIAAGKQQQDRLKQHRARVTKTNLKELSGNSGGSKSLKSTAAPPLSQQLPPHNSTHHSNNTLSPSPPIPKMVAVLSSNCKIKLHSNDTYEAVRKVSLAYTTRTSNNPTTTSSSSSVGLEEEEEDNCGGDDVETITSTSKREEKKTAAPPPRVKKDEADWHEVDSLESFLFSKEELSTLLSPSKSHGGKDEKRSNTNTNKSESAQHLRKQRKKLQERRRKAEKALVEQVLGGGGGIDTTSSSSTLLPLVEYVTPVARSMGSEVRSREIQAAKFLEMPLETGKEEGGSSRGIIVNGESTSRVQIPLLKRPSILTNNHSPIYNRSSNKNLSQQGATRIVRLTVYSPKYHPRLPRANTTTSTTDYFAQGGAPAPPFFYKAVKYAMEKAALPWDRTLDVPSKLQDTIHAICNNSSSISGGSEKNTNNNDTASESDPFQSLNQSPTGEDCDNNNVTPTSTTTTSTSTTSCLKSGDVLGMLLHIHHNRQFVSGEASASSSSSPSPTTDHPLKQQQQPERQHQQYGVLEGRNMERTFDTTFGFLTVRENVRGRKYLPRALSELLRTSDDAVLVSSLATSLGRIMSQQRRNEQQGHQQSPEAADIMSITNPLPMPASMLILLVGTSPYAPPKSCQHVQSIFGNRDDDQTLSTSFSWSNFTRRLIIGQRGYIVSSNKNGASRQRQLPTSVVDAALSAFITSAMYQTYFNIDTLNYTDEVDTITSSITSSPSASRYLSTPIHSINSGKDGDEEDDLAELLNAAATEQQKQQQLASSSGSRQQNNYDEGHSNNDGNLQLFQEAINEEDEVEMGATEAYWHVHEWQQQELNRLPLAQEWEGWTEGRRNTKASSTTPIGGISTTSAVAAPDQSLSSHRRQLAPSLWGAIKEIRYGGRISPSSSSSKRDFVNRLNFTDLRDVSVFAVFGLVSEPLARWVSEVLGCGGGSGHTTHNNNTTSPPPISLSVGATRLMLAAASAPQITTTMGGGHASSLSFVASSILRNSRSNTSIDCRSTSTNSTFGSNNNNPSDTTYSYVRGACLHHNHPLLPLLPPPPKLQQQSRYPSSTTTPLTLESLVALIPSINSHNYHNNNNNGTSPHTVTTTNTTTTTTRSTLAVQGALLESARLRGSNGTFANEVLRSYAHIATTTTTTTTSEASLPFERLMAVVSQHKQENQGTTTPSSLSSQPPLSGTFLMTVDKILKVEERLLLLLGLNVHHGLIEAAAAKGDVPLTIHFLSLLTSASSAARGGGGGMERRHNNDRGGGGSRSRGLSCTAILGASGPAVEGMWVAVGTMVQHGHTTSAEQLLALLQQCTTIHHLSNADNQPCVPDNCNWSVSPIFSGAYPELASHLTAPHGGGLSTLSVPSAAILFPSDTTDSNSSSYMRRKAVAAVYDARLRNVVTRSFGKPHGDGGATTVWCSGGIIALQLAVSLFVHQLGGGAQGGEASGVVVESSPLSSVMLMSCLRHLSDIVTTIPSTTTPTTPATPTPATTSSPLLSLEALLQTIDSTGGREEGGVGSNYRRVGVNHHTSSSSPLHPSHPCLPILTDALKMYCCIIGSLPTEVQARVLRWSTTASSVDDNVGGNADVKSVQSTNVSSSSTQTSATTMTPLTYCSRTGTFVSTQQQQSTPSSRARENNKERVREAKRAVMMQVEMNEEGGRKSMFGEVQGGAGQRRRDNDGSVVAGDNVEEDDVKRKRQIVELLTAPTTIAALMPLRSAVTITVFDHVHLLSNGIILPPQQPPSDGGGTANSSGSSGWKGGRHNTSYFSSSSRYQHQYAPLQFIPKGDYAFRGDVLSPVGDHKTLDVLHGAAAELFMQLLLSQIEKIDGEKKQQEQLKEVVRRFGATAAASNELFSSLAFHHHMGSGYEPGIEGSVSLLDQNAAPQSSSPQGRGGSRRMAQIKALMKRDYLVMRAHSRALIAELVFPLIMGTLACLFLSVFTTMSTGFNASPYVNSYCNTYFTSYGPANMTHVEDLNLRPGGTYVPRACGSWALPSYWVPHDNATSLLDSYVDYVATINNIDGDTDGRLGAIMYFQNFSTPHNNINVYQTQQISIWSTVSLGWAVNTLFNGPSTVDIQLGISSNVVQFNMKQMFCTSAAIMLTMTFLPMASTMAGRLVDEKKAKVREHLKVMGVTSTSYLIAAFLVAMLRVGFVSLTLLVLIGSFQIVHFKYLIVVWFSIVFYGFSLAGFAQMMPAFFGRSTMSNAACSLFIAIPGIAAVFASQIPALVPVMAILFSPAAFVFSAAQLLNNNFVELPVSPGGCIGCLIFQMFLYSAIAQYLYSINPGEFGVPRPLLFPIHDLVALFSKKKSLGESEPLLNSIGADGNESPLSGGKRDRIVLENLVKVFGNEVDKPAVNKLSLRIREKEIFALLGHNGAGKTTTISMLIGMLNSTSYDVAKVLGYDLNTDMDNIREHIGICPQFDVLFEDLSARQHLDLYAAIKGRPVVDGDALLTKLKLPLDNQKASTFSGGMKRRLSVGNALVGDSPILFLDEPSSGLDPVSRRQLWELLREEKNVKGKTIVLTTHFMEEADYLGDRIGIMSSGRLYCCDTSANLKSTYGVGYYLNFAKASTAKGSAEHAGDSFNKGLASEILGRYVEGWTLKQDSVGDITYLLPAASLPCFGEMLAEIESNLSNLGSSSYGLAMNTLEDVFVNISEKEVASAAAAAGKSVVDVAALDTTHTASGVLLEDLFSTAAINTPFLPRLLSQTWTIYIKKWMAFSRSLRIIFTCVVIPMILVGAGFGAAIPNFLNNQSNTQTWNSYYANAEWPDESNMEIFICQESDNWGPSLDKVLDTFTSMYIEYEHIRGFPNPQFSFRRVSKEHYKQGAFLSDGTISFLTQFNPVVQMMFSDDMNSDAITNPDAPSASLAMFFNDQSWSAMYAVPLSAIMRASIETVWRQANGNNTPVLLPVGIPIQVPIPPLGNHTAAPTTTTTTTQTPSNNTAPPGEPGDGNPEFLLVGLGALVNICIGQFAGGVMLPLADELNKHVFHTMRLQGLSAAAFWFGTFGFDMTTGASIMVAYIIGCYGRGVTQIQNDLLPFQCFVMVGAVGFAVLMVYALVLFLPSDLKPSTYMYASSGVYYLTLLIPMVAYIALVVSNKDSPTWLNVITPSRALYATIVADPRPTSSVWTSELGVGVGVSLGIWNAVMIALIIFKSYISPRRSFASTPDSIDHNNSSAYQQPIIGVPLSDHNNPSSALDPDVLGEMQRVATATDNMATTSHLRKVFPNVSTAGSADRDQSMASTIISTKCDKVAVNDLTFGVRSGECFGLLGPNGAGKTTTVKMMMRETAPSYGSVSFPYAPEATDVDHGVLGSMDNSYKLARLGACQQGDTLWENFSAAEHMRLYLRIRLGGLYKEKELEQYISNALQKVALDDVSDKPAGSYSGGMKRKLSVCIAMYTGARTVFLDEPSTGMDPYARRALWRSIGEALQNDRCVLLTTHSMEEADAVCGRIGIVTGGVLQCIGSGQHLKNRFGSGFSITVTLHPRDANNAIVTNTESEGSTDTVAARQTEEAGKAVDSMLANIFTDCGFELKEVLNLQRRYSVTKLPSLSFAFKTLNAQQQALGIANYSVSQLTSLEQIFINFAGSTTQSGN